MFVTPYIAGVRYLLIRSPGELARVKVYSAGEVGTLFRLSEIIALDAGLPLEKDGSTFVDMVIAASAPVVS